MILESTIGAIVGGAFRLVPEFLKTLDRKNERGHELKMLDAEMRFASLRAEQEMRKIDAAMTISEMDAITKAVTEQGQTARAAGSFVAAISALVRPLVTYWFVCMYSAVKIVGMQMAIMAGGDWRDVLIKSWTTDDMSMLTMILTFWFIGRVFERQQKGA
jgi:hypothetical protein